ncbi:hypothetical protein LG291_25090 (plasmid) [Cytobacillus firmus]|uniref:hypothetical protein n=1 Tax=Bacillaceae TaxID=186817 RepID=UPI001A8F05AF|nr:MULTISPECIES: hypothetical protein [Bacillaceae]MBN8203887.1 hypothetical protein [Bacillus sp. NTK034]
MNIPFCYHQRIEMFTDIKRGHIHLLELTENELSHNKLKKLIHQISELNNIAPSLFNWIYYGDGKAYGVSTSMISHLARSDERLYSQYRKRMVLAAPFRIF